MNVQEPVSRRGRSTLRLLRSFELEHDGRVIRLPMSTQRLVAFVALGDRRIHRLHVAGCLWIDTSEESANASLRTALWRLGKMGPPIVTATSTHLELSDRVVVDVDDTARQVARVLHEGGGGSAVVGDLSNAGELLPDWYDDWVLIERERLRQLVLHALERLSADARVDGRLAEATEAGLAAVAYEPLRESAHRLVMEAHLADGNRGEALRQYNLFRRLLGDGLGLEPSPQIQTLMNRIIQ